MNLKRISEFGLSMVLSLSSLLVIAVPKAHAVVDACTWTGAASDNFSNTANWSCAIDGAAVPENGDSLIFDNTTLTGDKTLNSDLGGLTLSGITYQGGSNNTFILTGGSFTLTGNVSNNSSAIQKIENNITLSANITFSSTTHAIDLGSLANGGSLSLGTYTATFSGDGNTTIYENISGSGNIVKNGSGSLKLDNSAGGTNTFTGTVSVNQGYLYITSASSLGTTAGGTTIADGAILLVQLQSDAPQLTLNEPLTIAGDGEGVGFTNYALYVSTCWSNGCVDNADLTLTGPIILTADTTFYASQNGKITISGALTGNFKLAVASGASGQIIINADPNGSATPNGTHRAPVESKTYADDQASVPISVGYNQTAIVTGTRQDVYVGDGGTLKGTGTVRSVEIAAGGHLAPGLSPGCLNSGDLTFVAGGIYDFEVGGVEACSGYDQMKVTGAVNLGNGTLSVVRFGNFAPAAGQTYQIITNDANEPIAGTFLNQAEGATFTADGYVYRISYVGGDGNDVVLTVVSVPASPNTGLQMLTNSPLATLGVTMLAAGTMLVITKKYNRVSSRR